MKPVLVLYGTREGQTRRIAEYLVSRLTDRGVPAEMVDAAGIHEGFSLDAYSAALVSASVHQGKHEQEVIGFVKRHRHELESMAAVFLSVSLSEAGAEDVSAPPEHRAQAAADVMTMIESFLVETDWRPARIKAVAGAILYTKYNFLLRFVMKRIARKAGGSTDTSRDHEYTDWKDLDHFVDEVVLAIHAGT